MRIWDKLLTTNSKEILTCLLWLFQNIVADSKEIRDFFVTSQLYGKILDIVSTNNIMSDVAIQIATLISNIHKIVSQIEPDNSIIEKSTQLVCSLIKLNNKETLIDCIWALANLTNVENSNIQNIIALSGVLETLITVMKSNLEDGRIKSAFLKILGNLSSGKDTIVNYMLNLGTLDLIVHFLSDQFFAIRRETIWVFANVAAGTKEQVQFLLNNGYMDIIKERLADNSMAVVTEAVWFISNCIAGSDLEMKLSLIARYSIFDILIECLKINNEKVVLLTLEALKSIFTEFKKINFDHNENTQNLFVQQFIKAGGGDILEKLQDAESDKVYQEVITIIREYFPVNN
jgi:hypothetical protein